MTVFCGLGQVEAVRPMKWVFVYVNWKRQYDLVALMCD